MICFFILTGCNIENENVHEGIDNEKKTPISEDLTDKVSLEEKILPPKFSITSFKMEYISKDKTLLFLIDYEIDVELYNILQSKDQQMYFSLEYPESLFLILGSTNSQLMMAEKPKSNNTKYQVQFKVNKDLSNKDLEVINDNISGFNLIIADKDKDAIAHYIDLNGFNDFGPDTSNSIHNRNGK